MKKTIRILAIVAVLSVIWLVARGQGGCSVTTVPVTIEADASRGDTTYNLADVYASGYLGTMKPDNPTNPTKYAVTVHVPVIRYQDEPKGSKKVELTVICQKQNDHYKHTHAILEIKEDGSVVAPSLDKNPS